MYAVEKDYKNTKAIPITLSNKYWNTLLEHLLIETASEMSSKLLYKAAKETLVEYLHKTSLNGCYLLYSIRRRKYQRSFWFMFIVLTVTFAIYVCTTILTGILRDPIVTTLDPHRYSVFEAPFPSVAVCSNNKFSRSSIREYAANISEASFSNETLEYWEQSLQMLAGIFNFDSIDFAEATKLHSILESIFGEPFKTSEVIKMLAPLCEDLIVKCFWAGEAISCRQQFKLKMFMDGPCCVFNYQYENLHSLLYPNSTGPPMGLVVLLNTSTRDYFYAEDSAIGFDIKLFSTQRIPDRTLGDMEQFHVDPGAYLNVELELVSQKTLDDTRAYSVQKRGCYFPYESKESGFDKSDCILACKIYFIASKCKCLPFYAFKNESHTKEECSLASLSCFNYYEYPLLNSLKCSDCFPRCSYNHYYFRKTTNALKDLYIRHGVKEFLGNISMEEQDLSLVKIFYTSEIGTRYNKKALFAWYHILANIGGVIGICMGCSIVNGIELIYFGCFRLLEKLLKMKKL